MPVYERRHARVPLRDPVKLALGLAPSVRGQSCGRVYHVAAERVADARHPPELAVEFPGQLVRRWVFVGWRAGRVEIEEVADHRCEVGY